MSDWIGASMKTLLALSRLDTGQAMVFLLVTLGAIMAFALGMYVTSGVLVDKIRAQNAADAAALAGAGVLADSLDLLTYVNWIRNGSYLLAHWGRATRRFAETLAKQAIRRSPQVANARAIQIGLVNGSVVVPVHNPALGARETGFLFVKWYKDTLGGRIGNRFVRVAAAPLPSITPSSISVHSVTGLSLPSVGVAEAIVHGRGLGLPKFRGGLGKLRGLPRESIRDMLEQAMVRR